MPGTGAEEWKILWNAARAFSERVAYPNSEFPTVTDGARCLLCQQNIVDRVGERLKRFEEFVRDDVQTRAEAAQKMASSLVETAARVDPKVIINDIAIDEIRNSQEATANDVDHFVQGVATTKNFVAQIDSDVNVTVPLLPESPYDKIVVIIADLKSKADDLEKVESNKRLEELAAEAAKLKAKQLLHHKKDVVRCDIEGRKQAVKYEACLRDVKTTGISRRSGELTAEHVTESLCRRFASELKKIDPQAFPVELKKTDTKRGMPYHQVKLICPDEVPVQEVLSEGEFRCVALAGFLTELATASHRAPIIFDDPVSSLDQRWRNRVAMRLVEEARARQVIVFTHDLVFFLMLQEQADSANIVHTSRHLERRRNNAGICKDGPPWFGMKVKNRLGVLRDKHQEATTVFKNSGEGLYNPMAAQIYGLLRETWERAVEEVLLDGVVMRFQREIKTQSLRKVLSTVNENDYQTIETGMGKCSTFMAGHDQAVPVSEPMPEPDELKSDIEILSDWVKSVRSRR